MSRREYRVSVVCSESGCTETAFYAASTRAEEARIYENYGGGKWKCLRHTRPDDVLSPVNLTRTVELTVEEKPYGRFFDGQNGFVHGAGYKAWANDFPVGTVLRVTAEIILPEEPTP